MRLFWRKLTVVLQVISLFSVAQAFSMQKPSAHCQVGWKQPCVTSPLSASQDEGTTSVKDKMIVDAGNILHPKTSSKKNVSTSRAGGRKRQRERPAKKLSPALITNLAKIVLPAAIVLWIVFQSLQSSIRPPSYVFYQSSVSESRILESNGQMRTTRKESVKSNLPSHLEQDNERRLMKPSLIPDRDFDRELDREIDREMKSMMRFQQSLLDDFF